MERPRVSVELFDKTFDEIEEFLQKKTPSRSWVADMNNQWPVGGGRNIVLSDDMGVELGSPKMESVSCIIWTERIERIKDSVITLVGPDIQESPNKSLPFGKMVLVGVSGFNEENTYNRYREMEGIRYSVDLKGYMLRAVSQFQKEWSRISKEALTKGFSFNVLGSSLIERFKEKDYVHAVELVFITSSPGDVKELMGITGKVARIIGAMSKMAQELSFDCTTCEYKDVCNEAGELKGMREALRRKRGEVVGCG